MYHGRSFYRLITEDENARKKVTWPLYGYITPTFSSRTHNQPPRPPEPKAVDSNPALPKDKPLSRQQLTGTSMSFTRCKILVHCAKNGLRLSCSEEAIPR
jgi:hypothetical protein